MMRVMNNVIEIHGDEYIVDSSVVLTSNPVKYNAYRVKDLKQVYISGGDIGSVYPVTRYSDYTELHELMYGKSSSGFTITNNSGTTIVNLNGNLTSTTGVIQKTNFDKIKKRIENAYLINKSTTTRGGISYTVYAEGAGSDENVLNIRTNDVRFDGVPVPLSAQELIDVMNTVFIKHNQKDTPSAIKDAERHIKILERL